MIEIILENLKVKAEIKKELVEENNMWRGDILIIKPWQKEYKRVGYLAHKLMVKRIRDIWERLKG